MRIRTTFWLILLFGLSATGPLLAQAEAPQAQMISYRFEFLGRDPADDWAKVLKLLNESPHVELPTKTVSQQKSNATLCDAARDGLDFREQNLRCANEVQGLLKVMNPTALVRSPAGTSVVVPDLPLMPMTWYALFDQEDAKDKRRYEQVRRGWDHLKLDEISLGGETQLAIRGYQAEIKLPDTPFYKALIENVVKTVSMRDPLLDREYVKVVPLSDKIAAPRFSKTPLEWFNTCRQGNGSKNPPKPHYATLLGLTGNPACVSNCTANTCPQIVLLDSVMPHPDIRKALGEAELDNDSPPCEEVEIDQSKHHGTHMAGIMVGAQTERSFAGLAPHARLSALPYVGASEREFLDSLRTRLWSMQRRIFVFASELKTGLAPDSSIAPERRWHMPPLIPDILNSGMLWVVAAGQSADGGRDIHSYSPRSPMNLGDSQNVLVVTACESCREANVRLWREANYSSSRLVNVVAPGGADSKIPATADARAYGLDRGTSQASAVVAGLAAAMLSCHPDKYLTGRMLKERILQTSTSLADSRQVSHGLVNAELALRDPSVNWVNFDGEGLRETPKVLWCVDTLLLGDGNGEGEHISTSRIRRITKRRTGDEMRWTVTHLPREQVSDSLPVNRNSKVSWPAILGRAGDNRPLLLLQYSPNEIVPVAAEKIDELLLSMNNDVVGTAYNHALCTRR